MGKTSKELVFMRGSRGGKGAEPTPRKITLFGFLYFDPPPPPPENVGPSLESWKIIVFFKNNRKLS